MSHALWYATRGFGVASIVLLTLVVALGVAGSVRLRSERLPRFLVVGLHRNITLLAVATLTVHVVTTVADAYTPISLRDAFIPFFSSYRPLWLGLGAVAFDLILILTVTSLLRARLGYRGWRMLHWLAYAAWPIALVHGLGTGTDARFGWLQMLSVACVLLVLGALALRLRASSASPTGRLLAGAGAVAAVLVGLLWYSGGPGASGWAARSGTPAAARRPAPVAVARTPVRTTQVVTFAPPFTAQLDAQLTQGVDKRNGLVRLDIRGRTRGGANGVLWIRLEGEPVAGGGVSMTASGASFGTSADPKAYVGDIVALEGTQLRLSLRNAGGRRLALDLVLQIAGDSRHVTGAIRAVPGGEPNE
jgi:DMSO/TMAO reductase YedYZ heme-binding membrane subunit